jgi:hypothetical protein
MDITLLQIQNGSYFDLMYFKKEIISYLSDKKFSTKSITLVKTLKMIDKEISKRKNGKICRQSECSFEVSAKSNKYSQPNSSCFPEFLNENTTKVELLHSKRGLEKFVLDNPHLVSRVATYLSSKEESIFDKTNRFSSGCKKEFDLSFKRSCSSEEDDEKKLNGKEKSTSPDSSEIELNEQNEKENVNKSSEFLSGNTYFLKKDIRFIDAEFDKYSNKNSYSQRTRSTDENSNCNQYLLEDEDYLLKSSLFDGSRLKQDFLPERVDDIHVDLFFG